MLAERYELRQLLGKGGMAEVHEALAYGAHGFTRRVAMKRLLSDASDDPMTVRMFLDEARIASKLHHAGVVSVIDYGVVDGAPFQVLELVDGWDAASLVRKATALGQAMPADIALTIATQVAHALAYAHEATDELGQPLGIVHRDVKPSNILVSRSGDVKLGDFGIALARERAAHTTGLVARGTPGFMAPEQLFGGRADPRTDIFALGCCIHALLTGTSPLTSAAGRAALLAGSRLELSPALPPDVAAIIAAATRLQPEQRPSSARQMAHHLGAALAQRLRIDATTRMIEWLRTLGDAPRAPLAHPSTIVLRAGSPPTDRDFVSGAATHVDTTQTSGAVPGIAAPRTEPPRAARGTIFVLAVCVPILLAVVAAAGLFAGRYLWRGAAVTDAGPSSPLAIDAGTTSDAEIVAAADASDVASPDASMLSREAPSSTSGRAQTPGTGPPIANGCLCIASKEPHVGLCHPARIAPTTCACKDPSSTSLCWVQFGPVPGIWGKCPDEMRSMPPGTREGLPCTGYPTLGRRIGQTDKWETYSGDATVGTLGSCHRCEDTRYYPRTHGARCIGIAPSTGEPANGMIACN